MQAGRRHLDLVVVWMLCPVLYWAILGVPKQVVVLVGIVYITIRLIKEVEI